jgi:hypothetical protein
MRTPLLLICVGLSCHVAGSDTFTGASLAVAGTDSFDRNNTFGWRFTPTTDIDVTALGYFDLSSLPSGTGAGLGQSHQVGIYRVSDQLLVASNTVPTGTAAPSSSNFRYVRLDTPVRLSSGTTYLVAGSALSMTPDAAASVTNWTMAPGIIYANSPPPTPGSPTLGTSQYLVSAHGNPPAVLTYPALAQTGLLPVFAANLQFTVVPPPVPPLLTSIQIQANTVQIGVTNLILGVTNFVQKSVDLSAWQDLQQFVPASTATNIAVETASDPAAFYRIRMAR